MPKSIVGGSLAVLVVVTLAGCGTIERSVFIHGADLALRGRHEVELAKLTAGEPPVSLKFDDRQFVLKGHQIVSGEGDVLAIRSQSTGAHGKTDQGSFRYLTIFFPRGTFVVDTPIRIGHPGGPFAFYSRGSLSMPGTNGCAGYSLKGRVTLHKLEDGTIESTLELPVILFSPLGFQGECKSEEVRDKVKAKQIGIGEFEDISR